MKLTEIRATATCCVILRSGFANVGNWVFFADEDQAETFAEEEGGRVVNEDGLAEKFEAMHCAEGRQPNQGANGRFVEYPSEEELEANGQTEDEWMEQHWDEEYAASAREAFENATVYAIETEEEEESAQ